MPTLEEILGKSPAITPGESLEDYFNTDNVAMDPIPYSALDEQPGIYEERESMIDNKYKAILEKCILIYEELHQYRTKPL